MDLLISPSYAILQRNWWEVISTCWIDDISDYHTPFFTIGSISTYDVQLFIGGYELQAQFHSVLPGS